MRRRVCHPHQSWHLSPAVGRRLVVGPGGHGEHSVCGVGWGGGGGGGGLPTQAFVVDGFPPATATPGAVSFGALCLLRKEADRCCI